jgi:hypothetical protein
MPATAPTNEPTTLQIIQDAIGWATAQGIRVRLGPYGVACTSSEGDVRWELDALAREPGVNPVGAAILRHQPPADEIPDAGCQALGVDIRWLSGFEDGLGNEEHDQRWTGAADKHVYLHGFESGALLRISILSRRRKPEAL